MTDEDNTATRGIRALRSRLAEQNPEFAAAEGISAGADAFCADVRRMLRDHREKQSATQTDVARKLAVRQSLISKVESAEGDLGLKTVYKYALALGFRPALVLLPISAPRAALQGDDILKALGDLIAQNGRLAR
jgi:ribosome-binding protein aMBF1 (putative translation factor)